MNAGMHRATEQMVGQFRSWVKGLAEDAARIQDGSGLNALERRMREQGQALLAQTFQGLLQVAMDALPASRTCPRCGGRRRHKGRRERGLISSLGAIRLEGVYWHCPQCGGQHSLEALSGGSASGVMRELLCLLGTSMASFAKAEMASVKLLGVRVSKAYILRLCRREGRSVALRPVEMDAEHPTDLIGSCDGTMVNTTQKGWKELKAYQFRHGEHRHGRAYLEPSDRFMPRVRRAAIALKAGRAERVFWVSDAAEWINKGIETQLPTAERIIDIWHAWQHVHEASRGVYPDNESKGQSWARRYCADLEAYGGRQVWRRLRHAKYVEPRRQAAVEALRAYLLKNADRLDYPTYKAKGWPISSGTMESFCKQLGQRLKGPGMRWSIAHLDSMTALVSLWTNEEWDTHWQPAA
jgi:rubredoxin